MFVLFIFLAILEGCGYMARIAFIMDRVFRKFGLSGKSFIPILIGTGCGIPGLMASRTIESDRDRKMTIITTTFIPCGAKLPVIALIAGALFNGEWWVAPSAYFVGMAAIISSGIILRKMSLFSGNPTPFVMELPSYHIPTVSSVLHSMWERGWSFVKKAGTIILVSAVAVWFLSSFGIVGGKLTMVEDLGDGFLAFIGKSIAWIFVPLGFGEWKATVAAFTGLIAKENVVGTLGILYGFAEVAEDGAEIWGSLALAFTPLAAYSFLIFNLLCAPCCAAIGAIKREMNNTKWTLFAVGYETGFAYLTALCVYQLGMLIGTGRFTAGSAVAILIAAVFLFMLFRPAAKPGAMKARLSAAVSQGLRSH
jgi:ferrous iron transport protein B